ncbi:transposase [Streptomyces sp. NPDC093970]|uniref:transposase n=1 Tax=Streptomyces sp. NPDC093970 TaxID=3155076 RepID=UPI0034435893
MGEQDVIALIDGVHQLVRAPNVMVWDRLNTHVSRRMRELVAERAWLTVFLLHAYSPDFHPVEWNSTVRNRLDECLQYRPHTLDGFIAGTALTLHDPSSS